MRSELTPFRRSDRCEICGQVVGEDELVALGGRRICAACKPLAVQRLLEGVPLLPAIPDRLAACELGLGVLFAMSWQVVKSDGAKIAALILLTSIPTELLLLGLSPEEPRMAFEVLGGAVLGVLVETVFGIFAAIGIAYLVNERLHGASPTFRQALGQSVARWLPGIGTGLLSLLIVVVLLLAFIVPGIVWMNYYAFGISVVALRDTAGLPALSYSKRLVRGRWWRVFGRLLTFFMISFGGAMCVAVPAAFLQEFPVVTVIANTLGRMSLAFFTLGSVVLFLNLDALDRAAPPS